jgi:hypothetical protein
MTGFDGIIEVEDNLFELQEHALSASKAKILLFWVAKNALQ